MATRPGILHHGLSRRWGVNALAVVLTLALALPAATAAQDDRPARDVCLRVEPVAGSQNASGLWRYTPKQMAKAIRQGMLEAVGPGRQCDEEWQPIVGTPRDDLIDVGETAWSKLEFHDGGRKVDVHFGNGVPECRGLSHVEMTTSDAGLDVRVFVGDLPFEESARFCNQPLLPWVTTVDLGERLAFGSDGEDREAEIAWQQKVQALKMEAVHELAERLPGYVEFFPHKSDYYEEDFRFTAEGRRYALQFFKNPETTKDDLVNLLLKQEGLNPTYPPYPGQEGPPPAD
jgi:hypothetical protein